MTPEPSGPVWKRYFKAMPVIFPLVGLFLLGLAVVQAVTFLGDESVGRIYWLRPVLALLYFLFWAGACLQRKAFAMAFLVLTILNVAFHLFGPDSVAKHALGDMLFLPIPVNIVFSFLLLFYFRRMR